MAELRSSLEDASSIEIAPPFVELSVKLTKFYSNTHKSNEGVAL